MCVFYESFCYGGPFTSGTHSHPVPFAGFFSDPKFVVVVVILYNQASGLRATPEQLK